MRIGDLRRHRAYNQRSEIRSQRSESTILILFLKSEIRNSKSSRCCHLALPSLGHYAAPSFVLRGIGQTTEDDSRQSTEDRREDSQAG